VRTRDSHPRNARCDDITRTRATSRASSSARASRATIRDALSLRGDMQARFHLPRQYVTIRVATERTQEGPPAPCIRASGV
jgi:hypothetical protein